MTLAQLIHSFLGQTSTPPTPRLEDQSRDLERLMTGQLKPNPASAAQLCKELDSLSRMQTGR